MVVDRDMIVRAVYFIGMLMNFSSLIITSYMITSFPGIVHESSPIPAYIFSSFGSVGIPFMGIILLGVWILVAVTLVLFRRYLPYPVIFQAGLLAVMFPGLILDLNNNIWYLVHIAWSLV